MRDLERELRDMMQRTADGVHHAPQPDRGLVRRARLRRARTVAIAGTAAFTLVIGGFAAAGSLSSDEALPPADPDSKESAFVDTWVSTDDDGSNQTMVVRASGEDAYEIVMRDDSASVCSGAPSTMTGTGRLAGDRELVIPSPVLTCDDESEPEALSGPPLEEQLRNFTFVHDPEADNLTDNLGVVWDRGETTESSGGMWPQSSLEEVRRAQRLADSGDPRYTWQVFPNWPPYHDGKPTLDPGDAELFTRFVEEKLGWEEFSWGVGPWGYPPEDWPWQFVVVRCAPGETNPLYPDDPDGRECAPTIDESRYETVMISADSPVRDATNETRPDGIWVVSRWQMLPSTAAPITSIDDFFRNQIQQVEPPSDAEATDVVTDFLQARVNGKGAEQYLAPADEEIDLLYATTSDAPYERFEFKLVRGPVWPGGWMEFEVRLFADGGTVVDQPFFVERRNDGGLLLLYGTLEDRDAPTTENGEVLGEPYSILDGEVIFDVPPPWYAFFDYGLDTIALVHPEDDGDFSVLPDPLPVKAGCRPSAAPGNAEELARSIRSDPDLEATEPVATTVGGIEALRMNVAAAAGASVCDSEGPPLVLRAAEPRGDLGPGLGRGDRMRLYLLDLPRGSSARILAIAFAAPEASFETMLEDEARIMGSFEFLTP